LKRTSEEQREDYNPVTIPQWNIPDGYAVKGLVVAFSHAYKHGFKPLTKRLRPFVGRDRDGAPRQISQADVTARSLLRRYNVRLACGKGRTRS